jgi:hypothetical protein
MMQMDLRTTLRATGLATSFSKAGFIYVVSTVHRRELGGFYQTSILKYSQSDWQAGPSQATPHMVYRIETLSQLQSVQEHFDTVRMALSKSEDAWEGTKAHQDHVMNMLSAGDNGNDRSLEIRWTDKKIKKLLWAANVNYKRGLFARLFS